MSSHNLWMTFKFGKLYSMIAKKRGAISCIISVSQGAWYYIPILYSRKYSVLSVVQLYYRLPHRSISLLASNLLLNHVCFFRYISQWWNHSKPTAAGAATSVDTRSTSDIKIITATEEKGGSRHLFGINSHNRPGLFLKSGAVDRDCSRYHLQKVWSIYRKTRSWNMQVTRSTEENGLDLRLVRDIYTVTWCVDICDLLSCTYMYHMHIYI